jgi:AmmeMemoRadiSam system protein A/AmmeMemoRadiSam system protein B
MERFFRRERWFMNSHVETVVEDPSARIAEGRLVSPIVCAVLMPHAPVLVPAVAGGRAQAASASRLAMCEAASRVVGSRPESIVIISPHSPRRPGAFGIWGEDVIAGSFAQFGTPEARARVPSDRQLADAIATESHCREMPMWFIRNHELDHGALVPLWFLVEAGWSGPTVVISLNYPHEGGLATLGEAIDAAARVLPRRIAIVASGDMSHRLTANAPSGFHPQARQFDECFMHLLRAGDYAGLERLDPDLRELAAEDAVDSTVIATAAVGWNASGHQVLSYQGPFGVGYGVAILFAAGSGSKPGKSILEHATHQDGEVLPNVARQSVEAALRGSHRSAPAASGEYLKAPHGVFVTIHRRTGKLRGCMGTLSPVGDNLISETWCSAREAAFHDPRFLPVQADELPGLRFEISVLHPPEKVSSRDELEPRIYGVIVSAADGRRGVLLPGIANIKTVERQIECARQKAWIGAQEKVELERFQVDKFAETD